MTVTLVRRGRPQKLLASLERYSKPVAMDAAGVYRVGGFDFPVQLIVTGELDAADHVWLASLAGDLETIQLRRLVGAAATLQNKGEQDLADSVLDVVARANTDAIERLKEEDEMGKSLYEIMKPEIDEAVTKARIAAIKEGFAEGMSEGIDCGMKKGMQQGMQQGRLDAMRDVVRRMLSRPGFSEKDICDLSGATPEEVRSIAASLEAIPA